MLDRITNDINEALKRGDKTTAEALRFIKNSLKNASINLGRDLTEDESIKIIRKEIKLRVEARDMYAANGRQELAAKEEFERGLCAQYVPSELGASEINKIITDVVNQFKEPVSFSQLMPAVMKVVAGKADGKTVSELVNKYIKEQTA